MDVEEGHGSAADWLAEDFAFEEIFRRMDGEQPCDPADTRAVEALGAVFRLLAGEIPESGRISLRNLGARTLGLLWLLRPDLVHGQSLNCISKRSSFQIWRISGELRRRLGISNRMQCVRLHLDDRGRRRGGAISQRSQKGGQG